MYLPTITNLLTDLCLYYYCLNRSLENALQKDLQDSLAPPVAYM